MGICLLSVKVSGAPSSWLCNCKCFFRPLYYTSCFQACTLQSEKHCTWARPCTRVPLWTPVSRAWTALMQKMANLLQRCKQTHGNRFGSSINCRTVRVYRRVVQLAWYSTRRKQKRGAQQRPSQQQENATFVTKIVPKLRCGTVMLKSGKIFFLAFPLF